jgi:hypothetical protein
MILEAMETGGVEAVRSIYDDIKPQAQQQEQELVNPYSIEPASSVEYFSNLQYIDSSYPAQLYNSPTGVLYQDEQGNPLYAYTDELGNQYWVDTFGNYYWMDEEGNWRQYAPVHCKVVTFVKLNRSLDDYEYGYVYPDATQIPVAHPEGTIDSVANST